MKVSAIDSFYCVRLFTWIVPSICMTNENEMDVTMMMQQDHENCNSTQHFTAAFAMTTFFNFQSKVLHLNTVFVGCRRHAHTNLSMTKWKGKHSIHFQLHAFHVKLFFATFFRFHTFSIAHHKIKIKVRHAFYSARFMRIR